MITPSDRIILIRDSLNIFVCGMIGFLPVIGFIPAMFAIVRAVRLSARFRSEWNPAAVYLRVGVVMALLGSGITALGGLVAVLNLIPPFAGGLSERRRALPPARGLRAASVSERVETQC